MRIEEIRRGLAPRLRARRIEIEQATLTRVSSISDPNEKPDPEYSEGIGAAVSAAIDFGIEAVERSEEHPPPLPVVLLSQARLAARHGVKLETILRRYLAGYTLLGDFLIEESERCGPLDGASLKRLLRVQAALLDRLIAAVSEEYEREARAKPGSAERRLAKKIEQLLEGQRLDTSELPYDFDAVHLGLVAKGPGAEEAVREITQPLDRRLLLVPRGEGTVWAWLGGRRALDPDSLRCVLSSKLSPGLCLALGESAESLGGWRLSHRQAKAALLVARESPDPVVRYADVALLASVLQDELLATSLREIYLAPLDEGGDGGELARQTLRAYLAAEGNISSTAAALRVNRKTVASRLRTVEAAIGRPISSRLAEIGAALRIEDARGAALAQQRPLR
jgi:hypothetical protein